MRRIILGIVLGIIAGGLTVTGIEMISHSIYPLPEGLQPFNPDHHERFVEFVRGLPTTALVLVLVGHTVGTLVGVFVGSAITRGKYWWVAAIVGGFFLLGGTINLMLLPHPHWFDFSERIAYPLATVIAWGIASLIWPQRPIEGEPAE
ncbi:MAG: hypothetical protein R3C03_08270 [Pirellulaceae bacterium]